MSKLGRQLGGSEELIRRPRVTERSTTLAMNADHPTYTFEVAAHATKSGVAQAIKKLYGVTPKKVNMVTLPAKTILVRGKYGRKPAVKKALVFLAKGDSIELA